MASALEFCHQHKFYQGSFSPFGLIRCQGRFIEYENWNQFWLDLHLKAAWRCASFGLKYLDSTSNAFEEEVPEIQLQFYWIKTRKLPFRPNQLRGMAEGDIAKRCESLLDESRPVNEPIAVWCYQQGKLMDTNIRIGTVVKVPDVPSEANGKKIRLTFDIVWAVYQVTALAGANEEIDREYYAVVLGRQRRRQALKADDEVVRDKGEKS
ncbi:hypothetical protein QBC36DRAFT_309234 [Triangularia setosa]|uniref:Uncharacterized protein n=1 Tax=Triangularia setosa TaxID=2587417 RepID=A0AAN6WAR0_9PEZI|nr:hypothetical protein QBC36DRAFT_309234 [Podospora setosa]